MNSRRNAHPIVCSLAIVFGAALLVASATIFATVNKGAWSFIAVVKVGTLAALGIDLLWSGIAGKYPYTVEVFLNDAPY